MISNVCNAVKLTARTHHWHAAFQRYQDELNYRRKEEPSPLNVHQTKGDMEGETVVKDIISVVSNYYKYSEAHFSFAHIPNKVFTGIYFH